MTMTVAARGWKVTVPAGTYFLGDPCYAVPDDQWGDLLDSAGYFNDSPVGATPDGVPVLAFRTAYGDGRYYDDHGDAEYPVDAGMIGLVPVSACPGARRDRLEKLGRIVTFRHRTTCTTDGEGRLAFGRYEIDTKED